MNPKNDRTQSRQTRPALSPSPGRRFRIEKLEERIAPHCKGRHRHYEECFTVDCTRGRCGQ
jgi:hypothetical protein